MLDLKNFKFDHMYPMLYNIYYSVVVCILFASIYYSDKMHIVYCQYLLLCCRVFIILLQGVSCLYTIGFKTSQIKSDSVYLILYNIYYFVAINTVFIITFIEKLYKLKCGMKLVFKEEGMCVVTRIINYETIPRRKTQLRCSRRSTGISCPTPTVKYIRVYISFNKEINYQNKPYR